MADWATYEVDSDLMDAVVAVIRAAEEAREELEFEEIWSVVAALDALRAKVEITS